MPPVFVITGPPGAGKTTLSHLLLRHFDLGFHLEVDTMRTGVVQGLADSVPWTEETERQFQVAEEAACDVAIRYQAAGFAVCVDHCRNLPRLEDLVTRRLAGIQVRKIALLPDLKVNLSRNSARQNKAFAPEILEETIRYVSDRMRHEMPPSGWLILDNSTLTPEETVACCLNFRT